MRDESSNNLYIMHKESNKTDEHRIRLFWLPALAIIERVFFGGREGVKLAMSGRRFGIIVIVSLSL